MEWPHVVSSAIALLAVVVALHSVRAAGKREHLRWKRERADRRRERLLGLYADWSSKLMDLLARAAQNQGISELPAEAKEIMTTSETLSLLDRLFVAQREVNRAAIAIALEEGKALGGEVEELSRRATSWNGKAQHSMHADLERILQAKLVSLRVDADCEI